MPLGDFELLLLRRAPPAPPGPLGLPHPTVGGQSQAQLSSGHRSDLAAALRTGLLGAVGDVSGGRGCLAGLLALRRVPGSEMSSGLQRSSGERRACSLASGAQVSVS